MSTILALVDGSQYDESVLDNAAFAALRLDAEVELVHVIGRRDLGSVPADMSGNLDLGERDELLRELAAHDEQRSKLARRRGHVILSNGAERLRGRGVGTVEESLVLGDLLEAVETRAAAFDLVVMGKRGEAADFASLHLGSNLERVMRRTTKPILIAARAFRPIGKILLAYDGGPSIAKAVDVLKISTFVTGCEIEIVKATSNRCDPEVDRVRDDLRAAGYDARSRTVAGDVDEAIVSECERGDIDLVVAGASGHSRLRDFLVGSTTAEIVRRCRRPVLVFR